MDAEATTDEAWHDAYGEVAWSGRRGAGVKFSRSKLLGGDGGKRAVHRGELEVSRKAIAQGRPECSRCPVCSCAFLFAQIARETAGAASTRSSLRPPISRRAKRRCEPRARCAARSRMCVYRRMGRAKRNPSSSAPASMGIASLHPSYKTVISREGDPAHPGYSSAPNLKTLCTRHRSQNNLPYDTTTPCS